MVRQVARREDHPSRKAKQGDVPRRSKQRSYGIRAKKEEHSALVGAGFEPTEDEDLWSKDGVWYGKEAALQHAWQEQGKADLRNGLPGERVSRGRGLY